MKQLIAQKLEIPGRTGDPSYTLEGPLDNRFQDLGDVISEAMKIIYPIAGIILFLYLLWGGYEILFSAGDPARMSAGKTKITHAIIGFVIVFVSLFLTQLVGVLFGFEVF